MSLWDNVSKDDTMEGLKIALNVMANTISDFMNAMDNRLDVIERKIGEILMAVKQPITISPPPPPPVLVKPELPKPKPYNLRQNILSELQEQFKRMGKVDD